MRLLTAIAFFWLVFNSLWLCHFFVVLFLQGEYLVTESSRLMAGFEVILTLATAALGVQRLIKLREA